MKLAGFTLLELLIVLLLASLLLWAALPSFHHLIYHQRANAQMHSLLATVQFARSEALRRGDIITLCKSGDTQTCGGQWQDGILVFADQAGNGDFSPEDELLNIQDTLSHGSQLRWQAFGSNNYFSFAPNGFTHHHNGTFILCPANNDNRYARALIISKSGRVRLSRDTTGDGFHEDSNGDPLQCCH